MTSPYEIALRLQTVKYFKMVGLAVLVFDYCIKLEAEISLTWGRKWDFIRILFVVARYTPFVDVPVDLIYSLGPTSSHVCLSLYQVISWFNVFGTIAAESLLLVRTYTLWGKNRVLLISLLLLALGCIAGSAVVGAEALSWFNYQDPPLGTAGCYQTQRIAIYAVNYALLVLFETGQFCFFVELLKPTLHSHIMPQCFSSLASPKTTVEPSHYASVLGWYILYSMYTSNVIGQYHSYKFPSVRICRVSRHTPVGVSQRFILPPSFQLTSHHETTTRASHLSHGSGLRWIRYSFALNILTHTIYLCKIGFLRAIPVQLTCLHQGACKNSVIFSVMKATSGGLALPPAT